MPLDSYSDNAMERAKDDAIQWLTGDPDGYPRSWRQELLDDERRGYIMYDGFEAPPIAGYEILEREGIVIRMEVVVKSGQERVHFRLVALPRS
jgi:hypothetical protein